MKPITYWVQNEAIDQLVKEYGAHLQDITPGTRRILIACLADEHNYYLPVHGEEHEAVAGHRLTQNLTRHEKDLLIEAIAATLTHRGNPWLETAREMVSIEQRHKAQKTGTPSP